MASARWPPAASASSVGFADQIDLVEHRAPCARATSPSLSQDRARPPRRCPRLASISSATMSASCAPPQAVVTMARSSRRRGAKMPGVSTNTSCAVPSIAMPRTSARVVCTFGLTIVTLAPTSALTSVDLPALGAPIRATKPQRRRRRLRSVARTRIARLAIGSSSRRLDAFARQHGGGGGLLGGALGAADAFGRRRAPAARPTRGIRDRGAARCARPRDRTASAGRAPAPIPAARSSDRAAAAPACACARPTAARSARRRPDSRRRGTPRRSAPRTRRRGSRVRRRPPEFASESPSLHRGAEIDRARHVGAGLAPHQIGEPARQLALVRLGKGAKQHVGDGEAEHVVAEEFEALIAAAAARAGERRDVRQRAVEQRLVGEAVADPLFELLAGSLRPCGSSHDREQPAPAHRPRPAPDFPGRLAVADREEDDLRRGRRCSRTARSRPGSARGCRSSCRGCRPS